MQKTQELKIYENYPEYPKFVLHIHDTDIQAKCRNENILTDMDE